MSILHHHQTGFSPLLLSPSSTTSSTTATTNPNNNNNNNQTLIFDNSDQGSVDSDYTSLGSSKFYGNGGSSSSLNRQGRSQSIDELASTTTTTIPTRHFNGLLTSNKFSNDPLQFVKIQPNIELIERAQEQLTLSESRKRLQENLKLTNNGLGNSAMMMDSNGTSGGNTKINDDDDTDWSKAVENWRQKREQKRQKSTSTHPIDDGPITSLSKIESSASNPPPPAKPVVQVKEPVDQPKTKTSTIIVPSLFPVEQTPPPARTKSKSPSPQRIKGPAKIREIFIHKPVEVRGFGFKLDGGPAQNRPIYISTLEDGSPADKAGLCVDDEILSMNDENVEHMTFDQVRKILKERNLRGSIKLVVKTYEDLVDDNSQTVTVTVGPTATGHSRTPSPQKPLSKSSAALAPSVTTTSTIRLSTSTPSPLSNTSVTSPVYTFLPFTPQPSVSSSDPTHRTAPSLNMFAPKPFRSSASLSLDTQTTNETTLMHSSPIQAFRKMLDPSNTKNESVYDKELQDLEAEFEKQLKGIDGTQRRETNTVEQQSTDRSRQTNRVLVNSLLSNPVLVTSTIVDQQQQQPNSKPTSPPAPLSSVQSFLHEPVINSKTFDQQQQQKERDELVNSPISQVRSYVEKQMDQLQQELEFGFARMPKISLSSSTQQNTIAPAEIKRDPQPVTIPVDLTYATPPKSNSISPQDSNTIPLRPSLKKSTSTQQELDQVPSDRTYGLQINPNERVLHYLQPYQQQSQPQQPRPSSGYTKRSVQDLPSMTTTEHRPSTAQSLERNVNELRVNMSSPYQQQPSPNYSSQPQFVNQQQKKVTIQLGDKVPPSRISSKVLHTTLNQAPKKTHYDDHSWIADDQRKPTIAPPPPPPPSQLSTYNNGKSSGRRSTPLAPQQDLNPTAMFHYQDQTQQQQHYHHSRSTQQRDYDIPANRLHQQKQRTKSPVRTTINSNNNNRVLSVSGKLRCSRCNDELGQGSAMVIESLGLYYHIECFRCFVCNIPLSSSLEGTDVRVRSHRLHCQNCFSDENGGWKSNV